MTKLADDVLLTSTVWLGHHAKAFTAQFERLRQTNLGRMVKVVGRSQQHLCKQNKCLKFQSSNIPKQPWTMCHVHMWNVM